MIGLFQRAAELQAFCEKRRWRFCFIGGVAVQRWGEPRTTRDVDVTLLTGFGSEEPFIRELLDEYRPRRPDATEFALEHRVLLLTCEDGTGLDIALGGLEFEERIVARATEHEILPGVTLRICSAEDLIVLKAFASRPVDWQDIRMILARQGVENLDWSHVFRQLRPLAEIKEEPEILAQLESLRDRLRSS